MSTTKTAPIATDIPRDQQIAVVEAQIAQWKRDRYGLQIDARVQKAVGAPPEAATQIAKQLGACEKALDMLGDLLKELQADA